MGTLIPWDHPPELLVITKAKCPERQRQGQAETLTGQQKTSPQEAQ